MSNQSLLREKAGKFRISVSLLESLPINIINRIFEDMVIMRAEMDYYSNSIEYVAYCIKFDTLEETQIVPKYEAVIDKRDFLGWVKIE